MDNNQAPSFEIPKTAENPPVYSGGQELDPNVSIEGTREILPAPVLLLMELHFQQYSQKN